MGTWNKNRKFDPEGDYRTYPNPGNLNIPLIRRRFLFMMEPIEVDLKEMKEPHKRVCFVPTEGPYCEDPEQCIMEVKEIQKRNMVFKGWPDIPFNFLIGGDGNIYEGRGWLLKYVNFGNASMQETLQIAYMGYYKDKEVPQQMVDLGTQLIEYGKHRKFISEEYSYMECPLEEYYQFPNCGLEAYYNGPQYKEFEATMPPPPPPRPPKSSAARTC